MSGLYQYKIQDRLLHSQPQWSTSDQPLLLSCFQPQSISNLFTHMNITNQAYQQFLTQPCFQPHLSSLINLLCNQCLFPTLTYVSKVTCYCVYMSIPRYNILAVKHKYQRQTGVTGKLRFSCGMITIGKLKLSLWHATYILDGTFDICQKITVRGIAWRFSCFH